MFIMKILSLFFIWQVVSVQAKSEESSLKNKEAEIPAEAKIINAIAKTYTTAKNKNMIKMNCVNCKSKIHRFAKKPVVEKENNDVIILKELKVV